MSRFTLLLLLISLTETLNAQGIISNPPGPDYCSLQTVTYSYIPGDPSNVVEWYVDEYGIDFSWSGTPLTSYAGTGFTITIPPFQYAPGILIRAQEVDLNGNVVWESYVYSVHTDAFNIPIYHNNNGCGTLEIAPPYSGWLAPQRWGMWYRDGIATGIIPTTIYGPMPGGTYQYKLLLSCSADTLFSDPVFINGIPEPQVLASGPTTFCDGDSVTLTLQPGFSVWNWQKNGVGIPGTGSTTSLTVTSAGSYTAQVYSQTGAGNCFQISTPIAVTVNSAAIISGLTEACSGETVTLTCTPATTYQWKRNGIDIPGATSQTLQVTQGGNYKATTTGLTCNISDAHYLQYYAKPSNIAISQSGPIQICKNEALTLTVTGNNITSWNWLRNGIPMPGSNIPSITVTKAGNYKCVVSNAIGCSKTTEVAKLTTPVANELPFKTVTIKPGSGGTDSYTTCAFGNFGTNFGNANTIEVSAWYKHFRTAERGYLKFDLSSIPEHAPIVTANLKLYADTSVVYQNGVQTLSVKRLTQNWLENTISWYNSPDSTVFQLSSLPITTALSNSTVAVGITDIVRHWSFNPADNYGVLLNLEEITSLAFQVGWMSFYSGDHPVASSRPKLTVKYSYADIIENGSLSFCTGGSVMFSSNPGYTYQWYKNNNAIPGANGANYTATTAGDYYVILSNTASCSVQSATKTVSVPCREGKLVTDEIVIIHQQNSDEIKVILPSHDGSISIYDITGRLMKTFDCFESECTFLSHNFVPGIYVVHVTSDGVVKTKKVVIE